MLNTIHILCFWFILCNALYKTKNVVYSIYLNLSLVFSLFLNFTVFYKFIINKFRCFSNLNTMRIILLFSGSKAFARAVCRSPAKKSRPAEKNLLRPRPYFNIFRNCPVPSLLPYFYLCSPFSRRSLYPGIFFSSNLSRNISYSASENSAVKSSSTLALFTMPMATEGASMASS